MLKLRDQAEEKEIPTTECNNIWRFDGQKTFGGIHNIAAFRPKNSNGDKINVQTTTAIDENCEEDGRLTQ